MEEFWVSPYLRDWDLLDRIVAEWAEIRTRYGLGLRATHEQIDAQFDAIFRTDPPEWPALRRLARELTCDEHLRGYIRCVYRGGLQPHQRQNRSADLVINAVLYRLVWRVARGAAGWLQDRAPDTRRARRSGASGPARHATVRDDQTLDHWGRFFGWRAMLTEIERAVGGMAGEPTSGETGLTDAPDPVDSGSQSPDERAAILEAAEGRLTRPEMAVFRDCMRVAWGDADDTNAAIAARHGITEEEVAEILIRGLSGPNQN